jgi:AcrR family transcriptional regulator
MAVRARRTQEERSAATRARLLEATLDGLADVGYARLTTTDVADRAGVSRGAQLHHYPTKAELVTAAMAHLFDKSEQEFRRAFARLPAGADRGAGAVDILWTLVSGRTFHAWLELTVAARTDAELRRAMRRLSDRTVGNVARTFHELFAPPAGPPSALYQIVPHFVFAVLHGMALEQIVVKDRGQWRRILDALKALSPLVMGGA